MKLRELTKRQLELLNFIRTSHKKGDFFNYLRQIYEDDTEWLHYIDVAEVVCADADSLTDVLEAPAHNELEKSLHNFIQAMVDEMHYKVF